MSGRHLSSSRAHVAPRAPHPAGAGPAPAPFLAHKDVANRGAAALSHCCTGTTGFVSEVKRKILGFLLRHVFIFPFCNFPVATNPTAVGMGQQNRVHCPIPLEWKERAANAGARGGIFTEAEAKFKGGTALCTLCSQTVVKREK